MLSETQTFPNHGDNFLFWNKITVGRGNSIVRQIWQGYSFDQQVRWRWYFEYRAALAKIVYPKLDVEYSWGKYLRTPDDIEKNLQNRIISAKRSITTFENKILQTIARINIEQRGMLFKQDPELDPTILELRRRLKNKQIALEELLTIKVEDFYQEQLKQYHAPQVWTDKSALLKKTKREIILREKN